MTKLISSLAKVFQKGHLKFRSEMFSLNFHFGGRRFSLARSCENRVKIGCLRTAMAQKCSRGAQVEAASQKINSGFLPDLHFRCQEKRQCPKSMRFHDVFVSVKTRVWFKVVISVSAGETDQPAHRASRQIRKSAEMASIKTLKKAVSISPA